MRGRFYDRLDLIRDQVFWLPIGHPESPGYDLVNKHQTVAFPA
jgi:hypothetical protein